MIILNAPGNVISVDFGVDADYLRNAVVSQIDTVCHRHLAANPLTWQWLHRFFTCPAVPFRPTPLWDSVNVDIIGCYSRFFTLSHDFCKKILHKLGSRKSNESRLNFQFICQRSSRLFLWSTITNIAMIVNCFINATTLILNSDTQNPRNARRASSCNRRCRDSRSHRS